MRPSAERFLLRKPHSGYSPRYERVANKVGSKISRQCTCIFSARALSDRPVAAVVAADLAKHCRLRSAGRRHLLMHGRRYQLRFLYPDRHLPILFQRRVPGTKRLSDRRNSRRSPGATVAGFRYDLSWLRDRCTTHVVVLAGIGWICVPRCGLVGFLRSGRIVVCDRADFVVMVYDRTRTRISLQGHP